HFFPGAHRAGPKRLPAGRLSSLSGAGARKANGNAGRSILAALSRRWSQGNALGRMADGRFALAGHHECQSIRVNAATMESDPERAHSGPRRICGHASARLDRSSVWVAVPVLESRSAWLWL